MKSTEQGLFVEVVLQPLFLSYLVPLQNQPVLQRLLGYVSLVALLLDLDPLVVLVQSLVQSVY